jgi:hypothetical protein
MAHFFGTTASIAKDLGIDHEAVLKSVEGSSLSDAFREANFALLEVPIPGSDANVKLYQVTEPGYNAAIFFVNVGNLDEEAAAKVRRFRESLMMNKAPMLDAQPVGTPGGDRPLPQVSGTRTQIDENLRRRAAEIISSGKLDMQMSGTFADVHRHLMQELGGDPGYQNVRGDMIARRAQLGL